MHCIQLIDDTYTLDSSMERVSYLSYRTCTSYMSHMSDTSHLPVHMSVISYICILYMISYCMISYWISWGEVSPGLQHVAGLAIFLPHVAPYNGVYCKVHCITILQKPHTYFVGFTILVINGGGLLISQNTEFPPYCNYHLYLNNGYLRLAEIVKDNNRGVTCNAESQSMGSQYEESQKPEETYLRKICRRHIQTQVFVETQYIILVWIHIYRVTDSLFDKTIHSPQ